MAKIERKDDSWRKTVCAHSARTRGNLSEVDQVPAEVGPIRPRAADEVIE
jgi:hypothetical protein